MDEALVWPKALDIRTKPCHARPKQTEPDQPAMLARQDQGKQAGAPTASYEPRAPRYAGTCTSSSKHLGCQSAGRSRAMHACIHGLESGKCACSRQPLDNPTRGSCQETKRK